MNDARTRIVLDEIEKHLEMLETNAAVLRCMAAETDQQIASLKAVRERLLGELISIPKAEELN